MNYYSHHIGDYRRDTVHLSLLEHGVYRQLLDMYYLSEEKIPEKTEVVYRRLCARTDEEKKAVDTVLSEFFKRDAGWIHKRCEAEISAYQGKADRARENGKLGGRPSKTKVVISRNPDKTETKANHKPITINHKPITNIKENTKEKKAATPEKPKASQTEIFLDGLDIDAWKKWIAYRKEKKKPITGASIEAAQKLLIQYGGPHNQQKVVDRSIANGWQGLFAIKNEHGGGMQNRQEAIEMANSQVVRDLNEALRNEGQI